MSAPSEAVIAVTEYTLSPLPLDHPDQQLIYNWNLTVEWRGEDQWAVKHIGYTLRADGDWEYEPSPSSRDDDYLTRCRFARDTALGMARKALPGISVNGSTYAEWQARRASR